MKVLVGAVLVIALTGCAALPISGPVRVGPDLSASVDNETFYYSPSGPIDGATQTEILNGFIAAGTGPLNDYAVAREYLNESIRSSWNPNQGVLIQRSSPEPIFSEEGIAQLEIQVAAKIDADGRYETLPVGSTEILEFAFTEEDGNWRLSEVPDVTVLIRPVFDVVFRSYSIYFYDRQQRFLVPELRFFPTTPATGTRLVNALLRGPSQWLRPAVFSAIPSGTRLSIDAVTVEDQIALVDLTARALVAGRVDRSLIKAQLDATLSQLPNIEKVAISIERSKQDIPDLQIPLLPLGSRPLVVLGESGLETLASSEIDPLPASEEFLSQLAVSEIALSKQAGWLAVLSDTGVFRTRYQEPGSQVEQVDSRAGIIAIDFDPQQYLWSVSRTSGAELLVTDGTGERSVVKAPWLAGEAVRGFELSFEGSRAVLLLQGIERNRVVVAGVVRDRTGLPIELTNPIEVANEIPQPSSVSFFDSTSLAVVNSSGDFTNAYIVSIGGTSRPIAGLSNSRSIVSAGSTSALYLLLDSGELFILRGSSWVSVRQGVLAITAVK
jgi:hypothetical protein